MRSEGFYINEKSTDTGWDRTSDLSICNTALYIYIYIYIGLDIKYPLFFSDFNET